MYIYDLPYLELKQCCNILDENELWEELGRAYMKFDANTVQQIKRTSMRGSSPTETLFTMWGNQNHTVLELFVLLNYMKQYRTMLVLKKFIDPKYHFLIKDADAIDREMFQQLQPAKVPEKQYNFPSSAADQKILNILPDHLAVVSRECNESADYVKPKSPLALRLGKNSKMLTASDLSCVIETAGSMPQISYEELQKATNNWDSAKLLGQGGFGKVFRGTWKCTQVAIKRIESKEDSPESHNEQIKQSITELYCLNSYRHDNILPLYGYSIGGPQPCLVYQYMPNGGLDRRLRTRHPEKVLSWPVRLNIAIGTARGLQFLHTIGDKPLIHGDIKSANILLDRIDTPRIGDFGLAREGPHADYTHIKVSRVHGTLPYLPDEFLRYKKFSTKVDTYSFGIVLFEIATALRAYTPDRTNKFLVDHVVNYDGDVAEIKDKRAADGDYIFAKLIEIGKLCVQRRAKDRPEMVQVLTELEGVL